jgi:hypothetical protein
MLRIPHNKAQIRPILRCVWVPQHLGANAPLTAVWIESVQTHAKNGDLPALSLGRAGNLAGAARRRDE